MGMNNKKLLKEEDLRRLIKGEFFGDFEPYTSGSQEEIEDYIRKLVATLNDSFIIQVEARGIKAYDFCWGGGYSSFTDVFAFRRNGTGTRKLPNGFDEISGIRLYISRLTPLVAFNEDRLLINPQNTGRSWGRLTSENLYLLPDPSWNAERDEIRTKITNAGYTFIPANLAREKLPFKANIPTILTKPPYTIFDAVFYWYD